MIIPVFYESVFEIATAPAESVYVSGRILLWREGQNWVGCGGQPRLVEARADDFVSVLEKLLDDLDDRVRAIFQGKSGIDGSMDNLLSSFSIASRDSKYGLSDWEFAQKSLRGPQDVDEALRGIAETSIRHGASWRRAGSALTSRRFMVPVTGF